MQTGNIIGFAYSAEGSDALQGFDPTTLEALPERFPLATESEVARAMERAATAAPACRALSGKQKAEFLRAIAERIEDLGDRLIERAVRETGLPQARIAGERGRTCGQLRLFAGLLEAGDWVEAVIDTALPDRQPAPRPDIRRMLQPLGPVVVFTASNFPLAFSTAGGDTASAFAAGCPVVVKAHESHPGTHALVAQAILEAARDTGMPEGIFASLYARGYATGAALVQHPLTRAVAFTGSYSGGKALFDLANQRAVPIPVFAEMGSVNPVFVLPGKLGDAQLAAQLAASVNLGAGQFCTNPGLIVVQDGPAAQTFIALLREAFSRQVPATMLNPGIHRHYETKRAEALATAGVTLEYAGSDASENLAGYPVVASVSDAGFLARPALQQEVFGPFTLVVRCAAGGGMEAVARSLDGQLTATVHGSREELAQSVDLIRLLEERVGRLIFNGVPTGVEVAAAMQHGGPYPASTDSRFTSVGTGAIRRFTRPLAWQDSPQELLPEALRNHNPLGIWRLVNGVWTQHPIV